MKDLIRMKSINDSGEQPVTSSRKVAAHFKKEHKHVIRDIKNLGCSDEFSQSNFEPSDYIDSRGKKQPKYILTFDGFMFLAMGYTGENAAKLKEDYIKAFNKYKDIAVGNLTTFQNDPFIALRMKQINMEKDIQDIKKDAGKNDKRINLLEAKIDQNIDYVTIRGYCNINKIKLSRNSMGRLGMKCVKKSREMGVEYSQVKDEREGHVNIYRSDIIDIVYNQ